MATRLGVDVGGTFTDLIFYDDETGEVQVAKQPTTPAAPERGVIATVLAATPENVLRASRYFLHGTTVGLNSLLERRGANVGLLATRGFRDILEIRRGASDDPYNPFWKPAKPLVPRRLRLPVTERILADGTVHMPLDKADVRDAFELFEREEVTSIAISFLHAYANPAHELEAARVLRELGFDGELSLSHEVSGEYREYERTSTTVIDAYVRPNTSSYLQRLQNSLSEAGFVGDLLVTRCGGGSMTFAQAAQRPFETILSGPVAGAEGAAELARNLDLGDVITADVGGTSFDTCLITNGRPQTIFEGNVLGLPVQTPWVDVRSIGAGGGSIAYVDIGGLLKVGPHSAGADPGPVSYGRGGTEPTVTDAMLVLGFLAAGRLASGIQTRRGEGQRRAAPACRATRLHDRPGRLRRADDRHREYGERDPRSDSRAGSGSEERNPRCIRRCRAVVRNTHCRRARDPKHRDSRLRRQLLSLGFARCRSDTDGGPDPGHAARQALDTPGERTARRSVFHARAKDRRE